MQQLVSVLAHAGDTLASLVPGDGASVPEADTDVFEEKAQQWLVTLNDVQTTLRTAIFQLRQANAMPLTPNVSSDARNASTGTGTSTLGATDQAPVEWDLLRQAMASRSLLPASDGADADAGAAEDQSPGFDPSRLLSREDATLSLNALRLEAQTWTELAAALRDLARLSSPDQEDASPPFSRPFQAPHRTTTEADRLLIDALIAQT